MRRATGGGTDVSISATGAGADGGGFRTLDGFKGGGFGVGSLAAGFFPDPCLPSSDLSVGELLVYFMLVSIKERTCGWLLNSSIAFAKAEDVTSSGVMQVEYLMRGFFIVIAVPSLPGIVNVFKNSHY